MQHDGPPRSLDQEIKCGGRYFSNAGPKGRGIKLQAYNREFTLRHTVMR